MPGSSVLVVEDTDEIRELVVTVLTKAGMDLRAVASGAACMEELRRQVPDVVLDLGLPDADGTEICRQIRAETQCYVLMLTARAEEVDLLIGLAVGADGYMAKPFSPRELVARVQAMLRFPRPVPAARAAVANPEETGRRLAVLEVDEESRAVRVDGAIVDLTRTEFDLLAALASRPGRVLQRETLLREVWQTDWEGNLRLVEAHMSNLRRKLVAAGLNSPEIRTVRGVGYRLVAA